MKNMFAIAAAALAISGSGFLGSAAANAAPVAAKAVIETAVPATSEVRYHGHHGYRGPMRHRGPMVRHGRGHHYGWSRGRRNPHHG